MPLSGTSAQRPALHPERVKPGHSRSADDRLQSTNRRSDTMLVADFWESFFLFLIFVPLAMIWAFALLDIFRRDDIGGGSKALWVATVIILPFVGTLIYLIVRPPGGTREERAIIDELNHEY